MDAYATKLWSAVFLLLTLLATVASAAEEAKPPYEPIEQVQIQGRIEGGQASFSIEFEVVANSTDDFLELAAGDLVLQDLRCEGSHRLHYDVENKAYRLRWSQPGRYRVSADLAARARPLKDAAWREVTFRVPPARRRALQVACDRADLQVQFPGALRLNRRMANEQLQVTAVLGPGKLFTLRWKPQVQRIEADLVLSARVNTVARLNVGAVQLDTLFRFDIPQGKVSHLRFAVPAGLSVTAVRGEFIRDWKLTAQGQGRELLVELSQPQTRQYLLQVIGDSPVPALPTQVVLPVIRPADPIRTDGHLAIGTDTAVELRIQETSGLTQVDQATFPRMSLATKQARALPTGSSFYYHFASSEYQLSLDLEQIVPVYDVDHRLLVTVKEDDLLLRAAVELDIREAPLPSVSIELPPGFVLSAVTGSAVEDYSLQEGPDRPRPVVEVQFKKPVQGRTLVALEMELGRGPLGVAHVLSGLNVTGAKNQRGHVVLAAETGVDLDEPKVQNLREVPTASVKFAASGSRFAYRFRDPTWQISLQASRRPSGVRAEAFHLLSLGEGIAYGSVAVNYYISGAPVDELSFRAPEELENLEFVGRDVRRWDRVGPRWVVKLSRKVIGDYNLGVFYTRRYQSGDQLPVGLVECDGVDTQTGYIAASSHLNLKLEPQPAADEGLISIVREELPATYRLLVNAPIVATWKYVQAPHRAAVRVQTYQRELLLPAVVEHTHLQTRVRVNDDKEVESVTQVRYKVKNTSSQFLELLMPPGAMVWNAYVLEPGAQGQTQRQRVVASRQQIEVDGKTATLWKIPLKRKRNPNDPTTLEIEYAVAHGALASGQSLQLQAPRSLAEATFAGWQVAAHDGWALHASAGGNMVAEDRAEAPADLWRMLGETAKAWAWALARIGRQDQLLLFGGLGTLGLLGLVFFLRRAATVPTAAVIVLAAAAATGAVALSAPAVAATQRPGFDPSVSWLTSLGQADDLTTLNFTQPLHLGRAQGATVNTETSLEVAVSVVPDWQQHWFFGGSLLLLAAVVIPLVLGIIWKRGRCLLFAVSAAAALAVAAQLHSVPLADQRVEIPLLQILGHLLTWGLPAAALLYVLARLALRLSHAPVLRPVTAALLIGMVTLGTGCTISERLDGPRAAGDILEDVAVTATVEPDSLKVDYQIRASVDEPRKFRLIDDSAIALSAFRPQENIRLFVTEGHHWLALDDPGDYDLTVSFLTPLAAKQADGARRLELPLPLSLTNQVSIDIPRGGLALTSASAIRLQVTEEPETTRADAVFAPGQAATFAWRPRLRQTHREKAVFYATVNTLVHFDTAVATGHHRLALQIAQGELSSLKTRIPDGLTVTRVTGPSVGEWGFDPAQRILEVRFAKPVSGDYALFLVTQAAGAEAPWSAALANPEVLDAARQRGVIGLATSRSVYLQVTRPGPVIRSEDFARTAGHLIKDCKISVADIRHSYRFDAGAEPILVKVFAVQPELRTQQLAEFRVGDERLIYNSKITVDVTKAGVFFLQLNLPAEYDIDSLSAPGISHWDDTIVENSRQVRVHFRNRFQGQAVLDLALSQPLATVPPEVTVPQVRVEGALKHGGQVLVSAERGLRLQVARRRGISELDPRDLGIREPGLLAFKLLRPDWELDLGASVVQPRITVNFLHDAQVSDALVRHTHYLRYHLAHAGAKVFAVKVPDGVLGLRISGPEIAHMKEMGAGLWQVELARKWFDRPYPLTIEYETQYDLNKGQVDLEPVISDGGALYRGHVVVRTTEKVELQTREVDQRLEPAEARSIPRHFGAADLSDAAFTYRTTSPRYALKFDARRHADARLLDADVLAAALTTVVNERGHSINRLRLRLRVGAKRHLSSRLPTGARIWSVMVDRRATLPSRTADAAGADRILIPLGQGGFSELPVLVDLIYVMPPEKGWTKTTQRYEGPRFDLPLKNLNWRLYLPDDLDYTDFSGTLSVNEDLLREQIVQHYNLGTYRQQLQETVEQERRIALDYQKYSKKLAEEGRTEEARQALRSAYHYSFNDVGLNEDTLVQLRRLTSHQAMVGLKSRRRHLQPQQGGSTRGPLLRYDHGRFSLADLQRELGDLDKPDSENLERISARFIKAQESAVGETVPLTIHLATRGRVLEFDRNLQVQPDSPMVVVCEAELKPQKPKWRSWMAAGGAFLALLALMQLLPLVLRTRPASPTAAEPPLAETPAMPTLTMPVEADEPIATPRTAPTTPADQPPRPSSPLDQGAPPDADPDAPGGSDA